MLTRILSPNDFGVVTVATTVLSFVYVITDLGISKVIIQERGTEDYLQRVRHFKGYSLFMAEEVSGVEVSQLKRLKELEEENRRLEHMYAEPSIDNKIIKEAIEKKL